jgi:CMP-N-acetylneuraminic acid synthetase
MKILIIGNFLLSFILTASLVSNSLDQVVLAQDLSAIKDQATKLLTGNDNSQRTDNISTSTSDNSTSSGSSLSQKATDSLGGLLK